MNHIDCQSETHDAMFSLKPSMLSLLISSLLTYALIAQVAAQNDDYNDDENRARSAPGCIGHRGAPKTPPYPDENTLSSFRIALTQRTGVDAINEGATGVLGIELDLHLTRDDQLVVLHDDTLDRTTNGSGFVWDWDYADYVRYVRTQQGHHVPRFIDLLQLLENVSRDERRAVVLDIKPTNPVRIVDAIIRDFHEFQRRPGGANVWQKHRFYLGLWQKEFFDRAYELGWRSRYGKVMLITRSTSTIWQAWNHVDSISVDIKALKKDTKLWWYLKRRNNQRQDQFGAHDDKFWVAWTVNSKIDHTIAKLLGLDAVISDDPIDCARRRFPM